MPVEEKYGPHIREALSANQEWSCGTKLNSPTAYVNSASLQFDSPDGDKYSLCTLECHIRCNNDGKSTGRASSTRRAAISTSAKRKTNAPNTSAASTQLSAATASATLSQPLSPSQLDSIPLSQPTQSLTPAAADMVDISLSDDESLAAAVKEDIGPNQELGAKERLSNWFVDGYGRHLLCSVKIRQSYWITTNFSTRLFSDNGSKLDT
ncbi:hypothetical protein GQ42DRAFT_159759 [Ramicandelaber brevisporus]|nr:hypothetical protein GQ42DRAFT_159759 [Ramicandelaber brevisporus]